MNAIHNMHHSQRYQAELGEDLPQASIERAAWKALCGDAMADLKALDPLGWEAWYDANVEDGGWQHIAEQVIARVTELTKTRKHMLAIGKHSEGHTEIISKSAAQNFYR